MKISRNTHTTSSSFHRSNSKPSNSSSSSSAKPSKSSAAPSKPAKSSSSSPSRQVKQSSHTSKPQKTNPVPSKPVKKSTNSTLSKTVKKDSNSSKLVITGSGKTSSQSVNNVNVTKTGKVSNDNKKVSGGVKPVVQPNVVQSSKKNHKKDNNTDKKKRPNNGRESNNIVRGNYSITRSKTFSRENNYIKPVTKKFNSQQVLNGSAINIPSDMIPKGKKKNSTFFDMKPVADYLGRQGKKLVASGVVLMSALGETGLKIGKDIGKIGFKIGKTYVKIGTKIGKEVEQNIVKISVGITKFEVKIRLELSKASLKLTEEVTKFAIKRVGEEANKYLTKKIGKEAARLVIKIIDKEKAKLGINVEEKISKAFEDSRKVIDDAKDKVIDDLDKIVNKKEVKLANDSDWYKEWKKDLEINPNKTISRILDMVSNYEDETTTESKETGKKINKNSPRSVVTEGNYETAVKEFYSFNPINVKEIETPSYGKGLVGYLLDGGKDITISARQGSKSGGATLEIKISLRKNIKIRYR